MKLFERIKELFSSKTIVESIQVGPEDIVDPYEQFILKHRGYQKDALETTVNNSKGIIITPTGTGKSRLQQSLIVEEILDKKKQDTFCFCLISAHRLVLCSQLLTDLVKLVGIDMKHECNYLYVSSDDSSHKSLISGIRNKYNLKNEDLHMLSNEHMSFLATTNSKDISNFVKKSKNQKRPVICVSTYDSVDRLDVLDSIDICTLDEAHNATRDDFFDNINKILPMIKRQYSFTATPRESFDSETGMNHEDFWGKVLYELSPKKAIELGEIVPPSIFHIIKSSDDKNLNNILMICKTIREAFVEHEKNLKQYSKDKNKIGTKLLVTCSGCEQLKDILENINFQEWCFENHIDVFGVSSEIGEYYNFDKLSSRNAFLSKMNSMDDNQRSIIFHVDILAEGMDLPAITGILFLRKLTERKYIQTIGRALRLFPEDRINLYSQNIQPMEYNKMIKPFAEIIFPENLVESAEELKKIISKVYGTNSIPKEIFSDKEKFRGKPENDLEPINDDVELQRKAKEGELVHQFQFTDFFPEKNIKNEEDPEFAKYWKSLIEKI